MRVPDDHGVEVARCRLLVALRRTRGTALDVFGYAWVRRVERGLVAEYRGVIEESLASPSPAALRRAWLRLPRRRLLLDEVVDPIA